MAAGLAAALAVAAFWVYPPNAEAYREQPLEGPFEAISEVIFRADVPAGWPHDNKGVERNSRLMVLEDGVALGPAHAGVSTMEEEPGAFAHLRFGLWFTTSDHSDPNTNGRRYALRQPVAPPRAVHLGAVLLLHFLASFALWGAVERLRSRRAGRPAGRSKDLIQAAAQGILVLGTVQLAAWALLENELVTAGKVEETLYRAAFSGPGGEKLLEYNFEPHHYLIYALNGRKVRDGQRLHEGLYRLRRSRPLAPREEVDLRIVALGGSTTYDVAIRDEKDTWVHQLEERLQARYGPGVEVLNAGAGGYTLMENSIHYLTLLSHLEPDVVLLFTGHNDVHARIFGDLAPDYSNYRISWPPGQSEVPKPSSALSALYPYRLFYLQSRLRPALSRSVGQATHRRGGGSKSWRKQLSRNGPEIYRDALDNLVLLVRAQGREVAILPQYFTARERSDKVFGQAVAEHNEVGRQVARQRGALFIEGILDPEAFDPADTVDRCHFSDRGARKMAAIVDQALESSGVIETALSRRSGSRPEPVPGTRR